MTTRYDTITVTLEEATREDDLEHWINAIQMIEGVASAEPGKVDNLELVTLRGRKEGELIKAVRDVMASE